ncbi:MAG: hypothetical protein JWM95_1630 [Gemmatimonadetes bacterium]|nr:hypothetical protein [Gemmatimonadota bacterium]
MNHSISRSAQRAFMLSIAASGAGLAQAVTSTAAMNVKVRQLPAAVATTSDSIGSVASVRQLSNGNILVNDQARRRVVLMDPTMKLIGVVADTTSNTNRAYGASPGGLIAFRGDSTLLIATASLSMHLIDPNGKIVRTMAAPRASDINALIGGPRGNPGFDAKGRLVYRASVNEGRSLRTSQTGQTFTMLTPPDSAMLVRYDLITRTLDTVGYFKIPKSYSNISMDADGRPSFNVQNNPLPVVDDWAVLSDGTVAIVRGSDYHAEFIDAAGVRTVSDKIPYEWQRLTDDDKSRILDSAKVVLEKRRVAMPSAGGGRAPQMMTMTSEGPSTGLPPVRVAGAAPDSASLPPLVMVPISELSDYKPVFGVGAIRADSDERLWVRTIPTTPTTGGALYDVIDKSGKLVDRIQVPAGTAIAGFGTGGVVYLGMRDATGLHLQRVLSR